jgi:hypothetical protein
MADQNLLSRAPPCLGRHAKPLVPAAFAVVNTPFRFKEGWRQVLKKPVVKIIAESIHNLIKKHVVPTPLSGVRVGRRRRYIETPRPNTNRHVHAHKYLHCAGIEPATSCVVGEYSHHCARSAVTVIIGKGLLNTLHYFKKNLNCIHIFCKICAAVVKDDKIKCLMPIDLTSRRDQ